MVLLNQIVYLHVIDIKYMMLMVTMVTARWISKYNMYKWTIGLKE